MAALPLLAVTACGTGTGDDTGSDSGASPGSGEPSGNLTVWFPGNSEPEIELVTETLVPQFEEKYDAEVEVTFVDWADMSPKLNSAFAGGIAPDVFGHGVAATAGFAEFDRVEPLDDYIERLPQEDQDDLATPIDLARVDGAAYMIPLATDGTLVAYRKDLFAEAGLDPENPPTTWADAYEAAQQLTVADGGKVKVSGLMLKSALIPSTQVFAGLLESEGGSLLADDEAKTAWNSPEGVRALEFYANTFSGDQPVADQIGLQVPQAAQHPLATGAAAMADLNSAELTQIVTAVPELADKIGVMDPLAGSAQAKTFGGTGTGVFINADSEAKDLAWAFMEFMLSPDVSETYAQTKGNLPVRVSAGDGEYLTNSPLLQQYAAAAEAYVPNPNVSAWVEVRDVLSKHIEQALHGQVSAEDALAAAAGEADPLLSE